MLPALGVAVRESNRSILSDQAVNAAEFLVRPDDDPAQLQHDLREHRLGVVSLHAGSLPVCADEVPPRDHLDMLATLGADHRAAAIIVRCAHRKAQPSLDQACRNVERLQKAFGRTRLFLEHTAETVAGGAGTESEFLSQVLQKCGCGWLLDITSVFAASRNAHFDPYDFIAEVMPCASRVQMHLSGGEFDERTTSYRDTHSEDIPDEVWSLFRHALLLGSHKTQAVFIERDHNLPAPEGWLKEVRHAQFLVERVHGRQRMLAKRNIARRA